MKRKWKWKSMKIVRSQWSVIPILQNNQWGDIDAFRQTLMISFGIVLIPENKV